MARGAEEAQSERDGHVLRFACLHGVITELQVQVLLSAGRDAAAEALGRLAANGLVRPQRLGATGPAVFAVTEAGSSQIDGELPQTAPAVSLQHDVGVGWLWLAAQQGHFGSANEVVTGGELRAADRSPSGRQHSDRPDVMSSVQLGRGELGVRIELGEDVALHYPDLVLVDESGLTIVELVLMPWPVSIRVALLSAYAARDPVRRVILAVREPGAAWAIVRSPFAVGLRGMLEVYPVRLTEDLLLTASP